MAARSHGFLSVERVLVGLLGAAGVFFETSLTTDAFFFDDPQPYVPPLELEAPSGYNGTVLIVGGGAAGLFASYTLEYLGVDYRLLEASADVGGRVRQLDDFVDVPLDLGAEWIHVEPRVLRELLLFGNDAETVADRHPTIVYQPQTIGLVWRQILSQKLKLWRFDWLRFFYQDTKFYNTTWYSYLKEYVYPYVSDRVELNAVVETIDYSRSAVQRVTVSTRDGRTFEADKVIVATPVKILQQNDITFTPELPFGKKDEIDKVEMPPILKVWVEFDERFYPDFAVLDWSLFDSNDDLIIKLYMDSVFRKPSNRNALTLFEIGDTAADRVGLSDEALLQTVLGELDEIFEGKASKHYLQHYIQNWSKEPFVRGSYSINSRYDMKAILEPVGSNKQIYFAGEYLESEHRATVHGAGISGRSVAQQVLLDANR